MKMNVGLLVVTVCVDIFSSLPILVFFFNTRSMCDYLLVTDAYRLNDKNSTELAYTCSINSFRLSKTFIHKQSLLFNRSCTAASNALLSYLFKLLSAR